MSETKKKYIRDYKTEHERRSQVKKRVLCDLDRIKAEQFETALKEDETTFSNWLNARIDEYLKKA